MREDEPLSSLLGSRTVATAESCTGGLLAQALVALPGSGDWYRGGIVTYQRDVKIELLGVTLGPVVSERAATEMASGAAALFRSDVAVSITGAAGPEPHDGARPGTVIVATLVDGTIAAREYRFEGTPERVCMQARDAALEDLCRALARGDVPSRAG
jgi:nicotinamide-nucleotide amidase